MDSVMAEMIHYYTPGQHGIMNLCEPGTGWVSAEDYDAQVKKGGEQVSIQRYEVKGSDPMLLGKWCLFSDHEAELQAEKDAHLDLRRKLVELVAEWKQRVKGCRDGAKIELEAAIDDLEDLL
jgi:hypothetical protein